MIEKIAIYLVSLIFVIFVMSLAIWAFGILGLSFRDSVLAYVLCWVVMWDRRYLAQKIMDAMDGPAKANPPKISRDLLNAMREAERREAEIREGRNIAND